jgi:hypothetical protein
MSRRGFRVVHVTLRGCCAATWPPHRQRAQGTPVAVFLSRTVRAERMTMRNANRPAGPGKPTNERRDSVVEQEELEELGGDSPGATETTPRDPSRAARSAERAAHTKSQNATAASGTSRDRRRG